VGKTRTLAGADEVQDRDSGKGRVMPGGEGIDSGNEMQTKESIAEIKEKKQAPTGINCPRRSTRSGAAKREKGGETS